MTTRLAITPGDYNGIGPEVILKTLQEIDLKTVTPVVIGHPAIFDFYLQKCGLADPGFQVVDNINEIETGNIGLLSILNKEEIVIKPGENSERSGQAAMKSVEMALNLCQNGKADAMVTAPISKESVNKAGWSIPGHTEYLAERTASKKYMMMLVNDNLRVGLVSIHDPISAVPNLIVKEQVVHYLEVMHHSLKEDFELSSPRIAVLGLNPHAGDGGYIGREEITTIRPAIESVRQNHINAEGPFAADGFFGNRLYQEFDGVLAMYHDQGLIPFKTLSFNAGVNYTAGLPIIRTSPDHGTAFDIAGKNMASHKSLLKAVKLAEWLAEKRKS